jgi:DNA-binding transcriptional regulator YiaG
MSPADATLLVWMRAAVQSGQARTLREASGLSRSEVAAVAGCTAAAVRNWELARRVPKGEPARRYARLLDQLAGTA